MADNFFAQFGPAGGAPALDDQRKNNFFAQFDPTYQAQIPSFPAQTVYPASELMDVPVPDQSAFGLATDAGRQAMAAQALGALGATGPISTPYTETPVADLMMMQRMPTGQTEPGNINLFDRPIVQNPDGTVSTVRSMSIGQDGQEVLIPTVSDQGQIMSNQEAIDQYRRTGRHLGKFASVADANAYAQALHDQQAALVQETAPIQGPTQTDLEQAMAQRAGILAEPAPEELVAPEQDFAMRLARGQVGPQVDLTAATQPLRAVGQAAWQTLNEPIPGAAPLIHLGYQYGSPIGWVEDIAPNSTAGKWARDIRQALEGAGTGFATPGNLLLTAGLAALPAKSIVHNLIGLGFTEQQAKSTIDTYNAWKAATDPDEKRKLGIQFAVDTGLTALLGAGAAGMGEAKPATTPAGPKGFGIGDIRIGGEGEAPAAAAQAAIEAAAAETQAPAAAAVRTAADVHRRIQELVDQGVSEETAARQAVNEIQKGGGISAREEAGAAGGAAAEEAAAGQAALAGGAGEAGPGAGAQAPGRIGEEGGGAIQAPGGPGEISPGAPEAGGGGPAPEDRLGAAGGPVGEPVARGTADRGAGRAGGYWDPTTGEPVAAGTPGAVRSPPGVAAPTFPGVERRLAVEPPRGTDYGLPDAIRNTFTRVTTSTPEVDKLNADLQHPAVKAQFGIAPEGPAPRVVRVDSAAARAADGGKGQVSLAERLAKRDGLAIDWVRSANGQRLPFAGTRAPGKLIINVDARRDPVHIVAAHEIGHDMEARAPAVYDGLWKKIEPYLSPDYEKLAKSRGYSTDEIKHEFIADTIANVLRDPHRFAEALGDRNLAQRVLAHISEFIDRTLQKWGLRQGDPMTENLRSVQRDVMDALEAYRKGAQPEGAAAPRFALEPPRVNQEVNPQVQNVQHEDIGKTDVARVTESPMNTKIQAGVLRTQLPKNLTRGRAADVVNNAIDFFHRNLNRAFDHVSKQVWAEAASRQYEGYNIYSNKIGREFGRDPATVMAAESALSPNTSPDNSFEMTRRIMGMQRDAQNHVFDDRMAAAARKINEDSGKALYDRQDMRYLKGKSYSQLPTNDVIRAKWLRAYDQAYNPDRSLRVVKPDGELGGLVKGRGRTFSWVPFDQMQRAVDLLDGTRTIPEVLTSAKVSNYFMSKMLAGQASEHVVVDTHHANAAYGNSVPAEHPIVKRVFPSGKDKSGRFGGPYALIQEATLRAARDAGLDPKRFQALIWAYQRGFLSPVALGGARNPRSLAIEKLWQDANRGKITEEQAYAAVRKIAADYNGKPPAPDYFTEGRLGAERAPAQRPPGEPAELPARGGPPAEPAPGAGVAPAAPAPEAGIPAEPEPVAPRRFAREEQPPTQADLERDINDPRKMREHIATIQRMKEVSPEVKARVGKTDEALFDPMNVAEERRQAKAKVDAVGLDTARDEFMKSAGKDPQTLALGHELALRYDAMGASDPRNYDIAADIRDRMAAKATTPAQALAFIRTIEKTSPSGLIREARKATMESIRDSPAKVQTLGDINRLADQIAKIPEGPQKRAAIAAALEQLKKVNRRGEMVPVTKINDLIKRNQSGKLSGEELSNELAKSLKLPRFGEADRNRIVEAQRKYAEAEASGNRYMVMRRAGELMDAVYAKMPVSFWRKIRGAAVISMITHLKLPFRIGITDALRAAGQTGIDTIKNFNPIQRGGGDLVRLVTPGRKTITGEQVRAFAEGMREPDAAYLAGYRQARSEGKGRAGSFAEGMKTMVALSKMVTRGMGEPTDIKGPQHLFSSKFGQYAEDTMSMLHNTIPYSFWNGAYRASLIRQMRLAGVDMPTPDMVANARVHAFRAIFQNDTVANRVGMLARDMMNLGRGRAYGPGTASIPFSRIPGAILTEGATWSPVGFIRAIMQGVGKYMQDNSIKGRITDEPILPGDISDTLIKAAVGTGAPALMGLYLAKLGVITGAPDQDPKVENFRKDMGWGAYSLNLSELKRRILSGNWWTPSRLPQQGDTIMNYNWLEPFAIPVAMGADAWLSTKKGELDLKRGKIGKNALMSALGAGVQALTDQPMLQGLDSLAKAYAYGGLPDFFTQMAANIPGNFVPAILRQTNQLLDNNLRENRGGSDIEQAWNRITQEFLPGWSKRFPADYDTAGRAQLRYNYGPGNLLNIFLNPARVKTFDAIPGANEMQRLMESTGSASGMPNDPGRNITINGKQQQLDNEQLATYKRYVGANYSAMVAHLMSSPGFVRLPDPFKQQLLAQAASAVNNAAKIDLFGEKLVQPRVTVHGVQMALPSPEEMVAMQRGGAMGLNVPVSPAFPNLVQPPAVPPPLRRRPVWDLAPEMQPLIR